MKSRHDLEISLRGVVVSGRGLARKHISNEYAEFKEALGEDIVHGSLNVILDRPVMLNPSSARICSGGTRMLWPAAIDGVPAWIYRFSQAPLHVIELLSPIHLRSALNLEDGSPVVTSVSPSHMLALNGRQKLAWHAIWKGRAKWFYHNDGYYVRTRRFSEELGATQHISDRSTIRVLASFIKTGFR